MAIIVIISNVLYFLFVIEHIAPRSRFKTFKFQNFQIQRGGACLMDNELEGACAASAEPTMTHCDLQASTETILDCSGMPRMPGIHQTRTCYNFEITLLNLVEIDFDNRL